MNLSDFVNAFAAGLELADSAAPVAVNQRSGKAYQPGIGPHTETATVALALGALDDAVLPPLQVEVPYPELPRQRCDVVVEGEPGWAIEIKMLRMHGDNGKPNDNMLLHILSPYAKHRSAVTDCEKLLTSEFDARKALVIFGYESEDFPLAFAVDAFEVFAALRVDLSERYTAQFSGLIHPVHATGHVFGWELFGR